MRLKRVAAITGLISDFVDKYFSPGLWWVLFALSMFSVCDIGASFKFSTTLYLVYIVIVGGCKATLLCILTEFLLKYCRLKFVGWLAVTLYGFLCIVNFIGYQIYGIGITRKLFTIIFQTNYAEVREFIPGLFSNLTHLLDPVCSIVLAGVVALFFLSVKFISRPILLKTALLFIPMGLSVMIGTSIHFGMGKTLNFMFLRLPKYTYETYQDRKMLQELLGKRHAFPNPELVKSVGLAETIIVVIGESASKEHHSLYGYCLPTTPLMASHADSLFVFSDAISSSMSTAGNLERLLTFKEDDKTYGDWYKYPLIIDLFNSAQYKTFWLSNQERGGIFSNTSSAMASSADIVRYMGAISSEDQLTMKYDQVLLPEIRSALDDKAPYKIIFVHLMGSHTRYVYRYPKEFEVFDWQDVVSSRHAPWLSKSMAQTIAEYDNSIRYNDYILNEIFGYISATEKSAVMMYFSDHGELVYDYDKFIGRNSKAARVPFIIYANLPYRNQNPDMVQTMKSAVDLPFSTANVVYMMMSLSGISYPLYNGEKDIFSRDFVAQPRYVDEEIWEYETVSDNTGNSATLCDHSHLR